MNGQPTNQEPTFPKAQLIMEAEDRIRFTCPIPPGSVNGLAGWDQNLELEVLGKESFALVYEQRPIPPDWPAWHCKKVWGIMVGRGHVPKQFPGITVI